MRLELKPYTYYLDGRLFEWVMAATVMILGLEVVIWPMTLKAPSFQWISVFGNSVVIGLSLFAVGFTRIVALIMNGASLVAGPRIRSITALMCAALWVQFAVALVIISLNQGFASPGIPFWIVATIAELYVTYRAVLDVRSSF